MRPAVFSFVLLVVLLIALLELGAFIIGTHIIPGSPVSFILYYRQFKPDQEKVERYFAQRDPLLGWPAKDSLGTEKYDVTGARPLPSFPYSAKPCVSVYGDSYTYSSFVGPADAWSNLVAQSMGCRVANYGVPGYGTDQAYLRFVNYPQDGARFAILGVATVDIIRLVNQDRSLLWRADQGVLLKPRFSIAESNNLTLIEMPSFGPTQLSEYLDRPERFLKHEWFMPGTPDGPIVFELPYSIALLRGFTNPRIVNKLMGKPSWIQFYDRDHSSGALSLLTRITEQFVRLATERGIRPMVLIIPTSQDLIYARKEGKNPSVSYLEQLHERQIKHLDILPHMLRYLGENDVCDVFAEKTWLGFCWGHYNPKGEEVITSLVSEKLRQMDTAGYAQ